MKLNNHFFKFILVKKLISFDFFILLTSITFIEMELHVSAINSHISNVKGFN